MRLNIAFLTLAYFSNPVTSASTDIRRRTDEFPQDIAVYGQMDKKVVSLLPQQTKLSNPLTPKYNPEFEGLVKVHDLSTTKFIRMYSDASGDRIRKQFDPLFTTEQEPSDGDFAVDFDFMSVTPTGRVQEFKYSPEIASLVKTYVQETTRKDSEGGELNDARGKIHPDICCYEDYFRGLQVCYPDEKCIKKRRSMNVDEEQIDNGVDGAELDRARRYIFGADNRNDIGDASRWPFRAAGKVGNHCSGTLIGPRHVLTAGHCVHSGPGGDWIANLNFRPGYDDDGDVKEPYGSYPWVQATTVTAWAQHGRWSADYAVIELAHGPGHWMSFGWHSGLSTSWNMNMNGYHGDEWANQQNSYGGVIRADRDSFRYRWDTTKGTSGSGVYLYRSNSGSRVVYGVNNAQMHRAGDAKGGAEHYAPGHTANSYNHAVRITSSRFTRICGWINDPNVC